MRKQSELASLLGQLAHTLAYGTVEEAGELYREAEALSVAMTPATAAKPMLMQVVRKHLMQAFGGELMRIGTNISEKDLAEYDVVNELSHVIDELNRHDQR